jgi:ATP-dependent DNA helicase RecQ
MPRPQWNLDGLKRMIAHHWGFQTLRPLQEQAMRSVLEGRDSLVVLPTGGGKSLCYQAPAVLTGGLTVVISPLIALMKDQVDSLRECNVPAIQFDSTQSSFERTALRAEIKQGNMRLLFASPERLVVAGFQEFLQEMNVQTFAIDEAHCISHWGHDFRPEYRQLSLLKERFPGSVVHAYTATATERVRRDIIEQLRLREPEVLVGNFDRPNLTYRILPRLDLMKQVCEVVERHNGEAGIIYCLRRKDVDELAPSLRERGYKALPYHAGMSSEERHAAQEEFAAERCDLIVATVAFGMGIDRSNIRFILHTAMPKSIEHYQQETGRAGRDGLEAECVLLHSGADFISWKYLMEKSAQEPGADASFLPSALQHLNELDRYCRGAICRHRALVEYFGQSYPAATCTACDICLGDAESIPDATIVAQKILSCVARIAKNAEQQPGPSNFGINHVVGVLRGENTEGIRKWNHEQLSTYGLLGEHSKADVRDWVYQLIGQGVLVQDGGEYPVLRLNPQSWEVMKGQRSVRLTRLARRVKGEKPEKSTADMASWEGVDRELFEVLRNLRRDIASEQGKQPYLIFHDNVLREMARMRPASLEKMRWISGVGDVKLNDFGARFLGAIDAHCKKYDLARDVVAHPANLPEQPRGASRPNPQRDLAFRLFRRGATIEEVLQQTERSHGTIVEYLCDYIREAKPEGLAPWVADALYQRVAQAARQVGTDRLKPVFLMLNEEVPYDTIRLVLTHLNAVEK